MTSNRRRKYTIQRFYSVTCSECNEDISEGCPDTKQGAIAQRDVHEQWHVREDDTEAGEE